MATILEILTVNIATDDLDSSTNLFSALGMSHVEPEVISQPPEQITDVSFPLPLTGALSLIAPTDEDSPVARFLNRRGPGLYSLAVRVDDLPDAMREWRTAGLEWVLDEPRVAQPGSMLGTRVERLSMNWVKPSSLRGVLLEVFQFEGAVTPSVKGRSRAS